MMMSLPSFPLIAFTPAISVKIYDRHTDMIRIRLSEFQYQTAQQYGYDSKGNKWAFQFGPPPFPVNFWNELRNPSFTGNIAWRRINKYEASELKTMLFTLLDKEDEVLTEHEDGKYLRALIDNCSSFQEILKILNKYVFSVNEMELWREQEQR